MCVIIAARKPFTETSIQRHANKPATTVITSYSLNHHSSMPAIASVFARLPFREFRHAQLPHGELFGVPYW